VTVTWRASAQADIERMVAFVSQENPLAAMRLARELVLACDNLSQFPLRGRPGRVPKTRELVIVSPYIIVYDVGKKGDVSILRVWHGSQDWEVSVLVEN
jgi:toxin ParE1/3/4